MRTNPLSRVLPLVLIAAAAAAAGAEDGAAPAPAPAPAPVPAAEWHFPKEVEVAGRRLALHEPVVLDHDQAAERLALRFPAAVTDPLGRVSHGVVDAAGRAHLDLGSRLVLVDGLEVARAAFPGLPEADRKPVEDAVPAGWPKSVLLRLELVTARPGAAPAEQLPELKLLTEPPEIHVRRTPTVLIQVDGDPVLADVEQFPLEYVVNTAADLFRDPGTGTWYFLADGAWLEGKDLAGPWRPLEGKLPVVMSQIPIKHPRGHVRRFVPGTPEHKNRTAKEAREPGPVPEVLLSTRPAELVLLRGDPLFTLVPGLKLMVVANTESDLLFHPRSGLYYLLLSGRWFVSEDWAGPFKAHHGALPEEFARIPRDTAVGHVVWCVPGTAEADEAVAAARLWEHATLGQAAGVEVLYDGKEPRTAELEGTAARLVTNTEDDVLLLGGRYYACVRGAWFASDDGRSGWKPVDALPEDLLRVPESSGVLHLASCRPLGTTELGPRFAISGGYLGVFPLRGAPVHGTGWRLPGLLRAGNWYPQARTHGENRWYDPIAGVFQPRTVGYTEEGLAVAQEWSPYTASYGRVEAYADRYSQGGRRMYPYTPSADRFETSAPRPSVYGTWGPQIKAHEGLEPGRLPLAPRRPGDAVPSPALVADEAGNVYRTGADGRPEVWAEGKWQPAKACPAPAAEWLATRARIDARPAQWAAWAAKRRAALPVNPVVTPR